MLFESVFHRLNNYTKYNYKYSTKILDKIFGYLYKNNEVRMSKKDYKSNCKYYELVLSFDIETSSFMENDTKSSLMYIWQIDIMGFTVYGRTWDEFIECINKISDILRTNLENRLLIYVHNLSYEFQFMRKYLNIHACFNIDERKPVQVVLQNGIEFRCSYILSSNKLSTVGNHLKYTKRLNKLDGNLDYKKVRTPITNLTCKELQYAFNDVKVVTSYICEHIIKDGGTILNLKLTSTGYVRDYVRNMCFYGTPIKPKNVKKDKKYIDLMYELCINDSTEFNMLKEAFCGGFTHSNPMNRGDILEDVVCYDFTSSYPAVMCSEKYPMSDGCYLEQNELNLEYIRTHRDEYCYILRVEFVGPVKRKFLYDSSISKHKCEIVENSSVDNTIIDNGRLYETDSNILITCTDVDLFEIYLKCYKCDNIIIHKAIEYELDYLPKPIIESVLDLYYKKTTYKGDESKLDEYGDSKKLLNAIYGMAVTSIDRSEILYDNETDCWCNNDVDIDEIIFDYNTNKNRFLFYPWGVFITTYARRNLWTAIFEMQEDYIYSDTDSIYVINIDKHIDYIYNYNNDIKTKLYKCVDSYNIDRNKVEPKEGCLLGAWDFEGSYKYFKTLGAKRYLSYNNNKTLKATVAGTNKEMLPKYLLELAHNNILKAFELFTNGLVVPSEWTGKLCHTYIDSEISGSIVMHNNTIYHYKSLSGIHLAPTSFSMNSNMLTELVEEVLK